MAELQSTLPTVPRMPTNLAGAALNGGLFHPGACGDCIFLLAPGWRLSPPDRIAFAVIDGEGSFEILLSGDKIFGSLPPSGLALHRRWKGNGGGAGEKEHLRAKGWPASLTLRNGDT